MKKIYFIIALLSVTIFSAQQKDISPYYEIKKNYENFPENDIRAFRFVNKYISAARENRNYAHLVQAYKDAVYFSNDSDDKLKYADSTIAAALSSKNTDLISDSYLGKGIVYYFNYKQYKPALDEYLQIF